MKVDDVRRAFMRKLGAVEDRQGHHDFFYLDYQDSEYTVGKLSHSWSGNLNETQVRMLANKLHLENREFERFVECTLSREDMISVWQSRQRDLR